ncbi:hypothetical protein E4U14_000835 [Claviceps sp. LM454 group G7]|nr:hypothetical protein E4U14_000835 [Claviceps sp. LM454 group G7]
MESFILTNWLDPRGTSAVVAVVEPLPPFTDPSLTANLVCRVLFSIIANLLCLVPLRLLYRNGEFAAVVFILNVQVKNLDTTVNSLIWRNDDIRSWWPGFGWCDVNVYIQNISIGLFVTCLLAIVRNLAGQVGLMRANALTVQERRRRNLCQALIIFPFPIVQLAMTWPLTSQRYLVGTLIGCHWNPDLSWPFLVFFVLPPPIFALITAGYAVLIYKRFRKVAKTTATALSSNRIAQQRSQRARRRLYLMVISILIPFLPVVVALAVFNILQMRTNGVLPYDYNKVHNHELPIPWSTVVLMPSSQISWALMVNCYIPILTSIPIFVFFGMTKDAINDYRRIALFFGLGVLFPSLRQMYDPDKSFTVGDSSFGSRQTQSTVCAPSEAELLGSPVLSSHHVVLGMQNMKSHSSPNFSSHDTVHAETIPTTTTETMMTTRMPGHNPLLFSTRHNLSIPSFMRNCFARSKIPAKDAEHGTCSDPDRSFCVLEQPHQLSGSGQPSVHTNVWSEDPEPSSLGSSKYMANSVARGVQVKTSLSREI